MDLLRTPDDRFADLPGFDHPVSYAEVPDGEGGAVRLAYVEAGPADGTVVLLLHGEPSWSFLYRDVMDVLAGQGLRAVAPDLVGFGRSDKPARVEDHSYARHVEWVRALVVDVLDLRDITLVGQDWGGLIGLRLVAENPDRFARVVAANTGLPTGDLPMPDGVVAVPPGRRARRDARRRAPRAVRLPQAARRRRARGVRRSVPRRVLQGGAARDARAGADHP